MECKILEDSSIKINNIINNELEIFSKKIIESVNINSDIASYKDLINKKNIKIVEQESIITTLTEDIKELKKVSMISSLTKQVSEKNIIIKNLENKIKTLESKLKSEKNKVTELKSEIETKSLDDSISTTHSEIFDSMNNLNNTDNSKVDSPKFIDNQKKTENLVIKETKTNDILCGKEEENKELDEEEDEEDEEEEEEVLEVKIKKKIYYVSDNIIYKKNKDESIGKKLGIYINGKPVFDS